jgi:hypothetical protein
LVYEGDKKEMSHQRRISISVSEAAYRIFSENTDREYAENLFTFQQYRMNFKGAIFIKKFYGPFLFLAICK